MDGLLTLTLEAHNPAENRHRWYEVRVGRDLFGEWTVCLAYGRAGRAGQHKKYAGPEADELKACVREHLLRRLSAPRRIGCPYRVTRTDAADGFDAASWLPSDVMARFDRVTTGVTRGEAVSAGAVLLRPYPVTIHHDPHGSLVCNAATGTSLLSRDEGAAQKRLDC